VRPAGPPRARFLEVGGGLKLWMCERCQAARGRGPDQVEAAYHRVIRTCTGRGRCVRTRWSGAGSWGTHRPAASRLDGEVRGPAAVPAPAAPGRLPPGGRSGPGRGSILASPLPGGVVRRRGLVLVGAVVGDLQDLDDAERGAEAAKGRVQFWVDLGHVAMMPAGVGGGTRHVVARGGCWAPRSPLVSRRAVTTPGRVRAAAGLLGREAQGSGPAPPGTPGSRSPSPPPELAAFPPAGVGQRVLVDVRSDLPRCRRRR
jgi:hypothetical protein